MHPPDCPIFDYKRHENHKKLLRVRAGAVLNEILTRMMAYDDLAGDCREVHKHLFEGLTPRACDYFAGHFRGEAYRCLQHYPVRMGGGKHGTLPLAVAYDMKRLREHSRLMLSVLDAEHAGAKSEAEKKKRTVEVISRLVFLFWRIHPYADGNGHLGRVRIAALAWRYGYRVHSLEIHPRPESPTFEEAVHAYDQGRHEPFHLYLESCLTRKPAARAP